MHACSSDNKKRVFKKDVFKHYNSHFQQNRKESSIGNQEGSLPFYCVFSNSPFEVLAAVSHANQALRVCGFITYIR